jgi:hypothetical protein
MAAMHELVTAYRTTIDRSELMTDLASVAAVDRLQGSTGLHRIADHVAERAERAGLAVDLRHYAPGTRWWDFAAPQAPSPVSAALHIIGGPSSGLVTGYPDQPCSLARGSASTPTTGTTAPLIDLADAGDDLTGAFAVSAPLPRFGVGPLVDRLAAAGCVGVAVESHRRPDDDTVVDRLEVPDDCPLVVFSVSAAQARQLRAAVGSHVRLHAQHEPAAPMPVLYAHHRGTGRVRGLLMAHLCHPAPGANDNASGVAALLAVGRAAHRLHPHHDGFDIGFLWAPEMVGAAAYLHETPPEHRPDFAVSLDMVGGTDGHLIIEESPDHLASPIAAAFEAAAGIVSPAQPSYSGAVALPTWPRAVTPFVGASDHLLFADRSIAIPAGHIARWPDPAHHTSRDTIDRISPDELHRTAVMTAAAVTALSMGGDALDDIAAAMRHLHDQRLAAATQAGLDQLAAAHAARIGAASRATLHRWHPGSAPTPEPGHLSDRLTPDESALVRRWPGPWNLHNLHQALDASGRRELAALLGAGGADYARLAALALAVDDHTDLTGITRWAAHSSHLPVSTDTASAFAAVLHRAGWLATTEARGGD